jgi:orotate phosphoribosyltransferase
MSTKQLSELNVIDIFKETGALLSGHFRLTSGLHSASYFQCALVLQHPQYCRQLAEKIATHFYDTAVNVVISPAIGGIVVGQEVGRQLGVRTIFAERQDGIMQLRRGFQIKTGERVLVCEDVVTTGGSVTEVMNLMKEQGAEVCGVGMIVDRSNGSVNFEVNQYAVVQLATRTYSAEDCQLCRDGIPLRNPGSRNL